MKQPTVTKESNSSQNGKNFSRNQKQALLSETPSSQRKAISFGFINQDLRISFASFLRPASNASRYGAGAALREMPFAFGSGLSGSGMPSVINVR
jgi:hypothetical protein